MRRRILRQFKPHIAERGTTMTTGKNKRTRAVAEALSAAKVNTARVAKC